MTESALHSCPDFELLGAFFEGTADENERAIVEAHLDTCASCVAILGGVARWDLEDQQAHADTEDVVTVAPAPVVELRPRPRRWMYSVAASFVLAIALGSFWWNDSRDRLAPLRETAAAVETRPYAARVAGFPWREQEWNLRGKDDPDQAAPLRLRGKASEVLQDLGKSRRPRSLHAAGVAHLYLGDKKAAVEELRLATQAEPDNARYWNDLAAALLVDGKAGEAVAAADRALQLDPKQLDALFNRALGLEALRDVTGAIAAYEAYLRADPASPWAEEATSKLQRLQNAP